MRSFLLCLFFSLFVGPRCPVQPRAGFGLFGWLSEGRPKRCEAVCSGTVLFVRSSFCSIEASGGGAASPEPLAGVIV